MSSKGPIKMKQQMNGEKHITRLSGLHSSDQIKKYGYKKTDCVTCMGNKNCIELFIGKYRGEKLLERPRSRWRDN
jgi:hypothetical protein